MIPGGELQGNCMNALGVSFGLINPPLHFRQAGWFVSRV